MSLDHARAGRPAWRLDLGATVQQDGVRFRVWAPKRRRVDVVIEAPAQRVVRLRRRPRGYFAGLVHGVGAGARYRYRLEGDGDYPDPCSRFQPEGPHGPSLIVNPDAYRWRDSA